MKYLKAYNESSSEQFTNDEIDDIKDVFQDLIDEYNIMPYEYDEVDSITYILNTPSNKINILIYSPSNNTGIKEFEDEYKLVDDVNSFCDRLELMGYSTIIDTEYALNKQMNYEFIDMFKIEIMKYSKSYNESLLYKFTSDEVQDIKDIFMDISDEYNLVDYSMMSNQYDITKNTGYVFIHRIDDDKVIIYLSFLIADKKKMVIDVNNFDERLRSMGYYLKITTERSGSSDAKLNQIIKIIIDKSII